MRSHCTVLDYVDPLDDICDQVISVPTYVCVCKKSVEDFHCIYEKAVGSSGGTFGPASSGTHLEHRSLHLRTVPLVCHSSHIIT